MTDSVTNIRLSEQIDASIQKTEAVRLELKGDIVRLESKFDAVLNVEIAKLRDDLNTLKIRYATLATKLGVLGFVSASVIGAVIGVLVPKLI